MSDAPSEPPPEDAPRPWSIPWTAALTALLGMVMMRASLNQLALFGEGTAPTAHDVAGVMFVVLWRDAQDHHRAAGALAISGLLLSGLLMLASGRVLLRNRGAGWLWRQSLLAHAMHGLAALAAARAWLEGHVVVFQRVVASAQGKITLPPGGDAAEVARIWFSTWMLLRWLTIGFVLAVLWNARRAKVRPFLDGD